MNSKNEARKIKLEHWATIIHECMNSGMKVRDWCSQNQISKDTYHYWFKEVREAAITHNNEKLQISAPSFVEVPDAVPASAGAAGMHLLQSVWRMQWLKSLTMLLQKLFAWS